MDWCIGQFTSGRLDKPHVTALIVRQMTAAAARRRRCGRDGMVFRAMGVFVIGRKQVQRSREAIVNLLLRFVVLDVGC